MNLKLNLPFQHLNAHAQVLHKVLLLYGPQKPLEQVHMIAGEAGLTFSKVGF